MKITILSLKPLAGKIAELMVRTPSGKELPIMLPVDLLNELDEFEGGVVLAGDTLDLLPV